jgi:hypothetical protein
MSRASARLVNHRKGLQEQGTSIADFIDCASLTVYVYQISIWYHEGELLEA